MILCCQSHHRLVIGKRCCDIAGAVGQGGVAHVVAKLRLLRINLGYRSLPRVILFAGGKLIGEEHQFVDAAGEVL